MRKKVLLIAVFVGIAVIFATTGIHAGKEVKDEIIMKNPAYKKHKKSILTFTHKKHAEEYANDHPDLYPRKCGECHHDEDNKPLENLKDGDDVQNCIECHKKLGETPRKTKKKWKADKVSKKEQKKMKLEWHAEAIHYNCKDCHKKFNKKTKTKDAPTTCKKCHPKKKK